MIFASSINIYKLHRDGCVHIMLLSLLEQTTENPSVTKDRDDKDVCVFYPIGKFYVDFIITTLLNYQSLQ